MERLRSTMEIAILLPEALGFGPSWRWRYGPGADPYPRLRQLAAQESVGAPLAPFHDPMNPKAVLAPAPRPPL
jgi:hypothetical protein